MLGELSPALPCSYLGDELHGADVGVWPEQDVLQLRLLLVDVLHRELLGAISLVHTGVLVRGLWGRGSSGEGGEQGEHEGARSGSGRGSGLGGGEENWNRRGAGNLRRGRAGESAERGARGEPEGGPRGEFEIRLGEVAAARYAP